jgi:hypothetical protein
VETTAQAAFLLNERCQEAQGFLYSKPLPAGDFEAFLRTSRLASKLNTPAKRHGRAGRDLSQGSARSMGRRGIRRS